jgi:HAMP domain-containing protein
MADEASKGNIKGGKMQIEGNDEIADLSLSFNRMRRSVIKIVQLLRKIQAQTKTKTKS